MAACIGFGWAVAAENVVHAPQGGEGVLPPGTDLGEGRLEAPRELFHSLVQAGRKPYLASLGNLAFSSPSILGPVARQASISCETCHVGGTSNPRLYIPGLSSRPGTFDTTGGLFNPSADNHVLDAVRIPSLRGARFMAPYGHDGRIASLREFVRNVIVLEFAGSEPSPTMLDALVAYIQDIDLLPNPRLAADGRLAGGASAAEKRGQALFNRPFPGNPGLSCASCHVPSAAFVDHRQHNVGSGGFEKTPTLLNANFNAPYFHDGRYDTYAQAIDHFDRFFRIGLNARDKSDLAAYLTAVGDGRRPYEPASVDEKFTEISDFETVLEAAVANHDAGLVTLAADTIGGELRELIERFPDHKSAVVKDGRAERAKARQVLKNMVLSLRRTELAAEEGRFDDAATELAAYLGGRDDMFLALYDAEPYSLFDAGNQGAYLKAFEALQTARSGGNP